MKMAEQKTKMEKLVERAYKRMPEGIEKLREMRFHKDGYSLYVWDIEERIDPPYNYKDLARYSCTGHLTMRNDEKGWEITGLVSQGCQGFGLVPRRYDLSDTSTQYTPISVESVDNFADYVHHELKYFKGISMDPEYIKDFISEAVHPFRERKRKLAKLVEGVDFGKLDSEEK
jgi:hypothetical protein